MKYYIEFPINLYCNLQCSYCFHSEAFQLERDGKWDEKYRESRLFSLDQYISWRDKHLNGSEYICELHGGEMSHIKNREDVLNIISRFDKEKFQLQTNGLGDSEFYRKLFNFKNKIDRIGFTFHRYIIGNRIDLIKRFEENVMLVKDLGFKIYVKELLMVENRDKILENKSYWKKRGIDFRIQDFKGERGSTYEEYRNYTALDKLLIYSEYKHYDKECSCRVGYKNVLIAGFNLLDGNVYGCWQDKCVIGNIINDWYDPNYKISRDRDGINIKGVSKKYIGTYPKDVWKPGYEQKYKQITLEREHII